MHPIMRADQASVAIDQTVGLEIPGSAEKTAIMARSANGMLARIATSGTDKRELCELEADRTCHIENTPSAKTNTVAQRANPNTAVSRPCASIYSLRPTLILRLAVVDQKRAALWRASL
jgi:hypothetical protein